MKRMATWALYGVGAVAIAYLALYAYAVFTGRELQPGDPIHIFRKPDAPSYSMSPSFRGAKRTRNLEIPRCAIAHLRFDASHRPGMTLEGNYPAAAKRW